MFSFSFIDQFAPYHCEFPCMGSLEAESHIPQGDSSFRSGSSGRNHSLKEYDNGLVAQSIMKNRVPFYSK